jgi:nucleoside-diphosphate-sugar epimerase
MKRAFVTGGSGFLGGALIQRLRLEGVDVVALARSQASADKVALLGASSCRVDLTDAAGMEKGMRGCDVVFHAAAHFTEWDAYERFHQTNVVGTARVLSAALDARVPAVIAVGAAGALMGKPEPLSHVNEAAPRYQPKWAPYTATKAEAERLVLAANSDLLRTVVVSPPMIWGAGMPMLDEMLPLIESGAFALPGGGNHLVSTCHVANVVECMFLAVKHARGGHAYFVTDGEDLPLKKVVAGLLATRGLPSVKKSVPFPLAWLVASLVEPLWRALELKHKPPVTRQMLRMLGKEITLNTAKARIELNYIPVVSREDGLAGMQVIGLPNGPSSHRSLNHES